MSIVLARTKEIGLASSDPIEELIAAAAKGDRTAMESVLVAVERRVFSFAWRLSSDPAAVEDITQEVLIKIARNLKRYRPGSNLWAWIYRIVVNQAHDHHRGSVRGADVRSAGSASSTRIAAAAYDPELHEQIRRVQEALAILTTKERAAIILIEVEGYSSREAASILGTLAITVRTRAAHARTKLRRYLSRYYPELEGKS